jgi:hypothetical protein
MGGKIRRITKPCKGNGTEGLRLGIVGENEGDIVSWIKILIIKM